MSELSTIAGQVAVVTGGTAGIGFACARRFATEGAKVAVVARNRERGESVAKELTDAGGQAIFVAGECAAADDMRAAAATILDKWGGAHILVNCAGGFLGNPSLEEFTDEAWHSGIDWNLTTKLLITRELVPAMKRAGYGRIVNISSVAGRTGIRFAASDYSAGTASVIGLTRRLAVELAPFGITANVVASGTARSPRVERLGEERLARIAEAIPVGRLGKTEELAHGIWYLCTPGAAFTTGAVLDINGGAWTG